MILKGLHLRCLRVQLGVSWRVAKNVPFGRSRDLSETTNCTTAIGQNPELQRDGIATVSRHVYRNLRMQKIDSNALCNFRAGVGCAIDTMYKVLSFLPCPRSTSVPAQLPLQDHFRRS